jgi:flagellar hook-associated protein 2
LCDDARHHFGHIDFAQALGGMITNLSDSITRSGDGLADTQTQAITQDLDRISKREDDIQARLDRRRETLVKQFTAMEQALSVIQAQGSALTNAIKGLQSQSG